MPRINYIRLQYCTQQCRLERHIKNICQLLKDLRVVRKCPISALKSWSMGWGWSEMVNFMAVTTVVLISADWEVREAFSLGRRAAGDMRQSFPRHSATTFLVPSSVHSVCLGRCSIQMRP